MVFQWSLVHAMFLEPLVNPEGWDDPTTAEDSTLAHEIVGAFRGQYAFDSRLIPQAEQAIGGLYTIRGYPESIVAGDSAIVASLEYRYHLPRAFNIEAEPRELFGQAFGLLRSTSTVNPTGIWCSRRSWTSAAPTSATASRLRTTTRWWAWGSASSSCSSGI